KDVSAIGFFVGAAEWPRPQHFYKGEQYAAGQVSEGLPPDQAADRGQRGLRQRTGQRQRPPRPGLLRGEGGGRDRHSLRRADADGGGSLRPGERRKGGSLRPLPGSLKPSACRDKAGIPRTSPQYTSIETMDWGVFLCHMRT